MYEIQKDQTSPVNFFAGDFPVVTEAGDVKRKRRPVRGTPRSPETLTSFAALPQTTAPTAALSTT